MGKLKRTVIINEHINNVTGEIVETTREEKTFVSKTVVYNYSMFFASLCSLELLSSREIRFLLALSLRIDYDCSELDLSNALRIELGELFNCDRSTVRNIICKLVKCKLLLKQDNGKHLLSPHLFFKGNLKHLQQVREKYSNLLKSKS
jgi:hypothetical protein